MAEKKEGGAPTGLPEVDVILKGLLNQPGVEGFLVFNEAAVPVKWTNNGFIKPGTPNSNNPLPPQIVHNTALFSDLTEKSKAVTKSLLGDEGDLISMRLHTRNNEYIVSPFSGEGTLVVVQTAHSAENSTIIQIAEAAQAQALEEEKKGGPKK